MRPMRAFTAGGMAVLLLFAAGCSSAPAESVGDGSSGVTAVGAAAKNSPAAETSEASRVKTYEQVAELVNDSDLVVVAEVAAEQRQADLNGTAVTERVVHVIRTLKGETPEQVVISELGDGAGTFALQPGTTHLLFLSEYELQQGSPAGQFVITGVYAGDYQQASDGLFAKTDNDSPGLPQTLPADFAL